MIDEFTNALRENQQVYGVHLTDREHAKLARYYELLLRWNKRLHLVAPCPAHEFATRHVLESLTLLRHLPRDARIADVGSGGGLPIIPCLIAREDLRGTLIESSARKAVFLREAIKTVGCESRAVVVAQSFQQVLTPDVDFVTCRALDRFEELLPALLDWAPETSTLLLFAGREVIEEVQKLVNDVATEKLPDSDRRFLVIARVAARE